MKKNMLRTVATANALATAKALAKDNKGRVAAPIIMWLLGVPGFICGLLWLFVFRG